MKLTIEQYTAAYAADARRWTSTEPEIMSIAPPRRWTRARTLAALAAGPARVTT